MALYRSHPARGKNGGGKESDRRDRMMASILQDEGAGVCQSEAARRAKNRRGEDAVGGRPIALCRGNLTTQNARRGLHGTLA